MPPDDPTIRGFLAACLRGEQPSWPEAAKAEDVARASIYHGISGLLIEQRGALQCWPQPGVDRLRSEARGRAMWELRHRQNLSALLAVLHEEGVGSLVMKGTAIAYDLYETPATRVRGDTDLLIDRRDLPRAEAVLADLGYAAGVLGGVDVEFALQRPWSQTHPDGGQHLVDLHWQVMNAPSLKDLLTFAECDANARPLPRLSPHARVIDRVRLLIHTCLHRAVHCNTPYFVERTAHYGSGRLIWSYDIHLLAHSFDHGQWALFAELAKQKRVSRACLYGLVEARSSLGTDLPADVLRDLEQAVSKDRNSAYLVASTARARAWQDIGAIPGFASKFRYARARILPDPRFVRAKYPDMANASLPRVYARRFLDLVRSGLKAAAS